MNIFNKIGSFITDNFFKAKQTKEQKWLSDLIDFGSRSSSGIIITPEIALQVSAAYQAVNVISSQIAILPFPIYKKENAGRIKDRNNSIYSLLNTEFNEYMISFYGWQTVMVNALLTEAGYIYIERKNGLPIALYPITSTRVAKRIDKRTFEPQYVLDFGDEKLIVNYTDMIEIKGLSLDGLGAIDPIKLLKNILGLSKSAEDYSGEYFKNGIHPSGIFEHPSHISEDRIKQLKEDISEKYSGLGNRHKAMILEEGMKFQRIAAPPLEGQMIESRKFQVIEIARFFNIPPHKLMELERATWANIEEMNIQFVNDTLMPHIKKIEQSVNQQLIMPSDRAAGVYAEFNLEGLLRGRTSERFTSYAQARQWGWLSVNEIRDKENMSNIGAQGDIYLTPGNMSDSKEGKVEK